MVGEVAMPLLDTIRETLKTDNVTFAELARLPGFNGDLMISITSDKVANMILWANMSEEAVDAIETIRQEGEYQVVPTTPLTYIIDGCALAMPLAKSKRRYKKPHWIPVVFKRVKP